MIGGRCWTGISRTGRDRPLTASCGATYPPTCTCHWSADPANPISATNPWPWSRHPQNRNSMGLPKDTITTMENVGCLKRIRGIVRLVTGANSPTLWPRGEMMLKTATNLGPSLKHFVAVWGLGSAVNSRVQWREQLLRDIREGFRIINNPVDRNTFMETHNYESATNPKARPYVEQQIREEIAHDRYGIASSRYHIVSALGALAKNAEGTKFRLIHDASRPTGQSLNGVAVNGSFKYQSIQDAVKLVNCYWLAKVDFSNAYRSVGIHPSNYDVTGLKWKFVVDNQNTHFDKRLCFGGRKSHAIFNKLLHAVYSIMVARGFQNLVYYCDDWLVIGESQEVCRQCVLKLIWVLQKLGFHVNYNKVEGPQQSLKFLSFLFDTNAMTHQKGISNRLLEN